ncbi:MAG: hisS [Myxococcaceae bacterium]|nr:hisS [Myxococcaceae bacterium]
MSTQAPHTPTEARLARGFRDVEAAEIRRHDAMIATIRSVYERYGFEPLETPAFEYTDALGKFLPDQDRPNAGVFSLQDDDEAWLSLRYDLTAPLARYVAQNYERLPKPYRRYATGSVFRNEKSGPSRFRQFTQFDADTVGTENLAADAELCMLAADTFEALGIPRGDYVVKLNHRKLLDGVLAAIGVTQATDADGSQRLAVLRAVDKLDRLGKDGVLALLGPGRKDESGDFTKGAGLDAAAIDVVMRFVGATAQGEETALATVEALVGSTDAGREAVADLRHIDALLRAAGYGPDRIRFDSTVVRGLEYYTGPVFEAELTFEVKGDDGAPIRFGAVGGGGRYDDLVARFLGQKVPATGFSVGVSRLLSALGHLDKGAPAAALGPVVVLVMDRAELPRYQAIVQTLRHAGIRAEMYLGTSGMKPQMKYADRRGSPCVVIQGSNERANGEIQLKDLILGAKAAASIKDNKEWKEARPAQVTIKEADLVDEVRKMVALYT